MTELLWRGVGALAIVGGSALLGGWLSVIASVAATRRGVNADTSRLLETGIPALTVAIGAVLAIEYLFGLPMVAFGVTIGAVLVAFALASVPVLANLVGGIAFRMRRGATPGTRLRCGEDEGTVHELDWLGVRIRTDEDTQVLWPYAWLLVRPVHTLGDAVHRPLELSVTLTADTDLSELGPAMVQVATEVDGVVVEPAPRFVIDGLTSDGVIVVLRATVDASRADAVRSALWTALLAHLREAAVVVAA